MIENPLGDIRPKVAEFLRSFVDPSDTYHQSHIRRIARTIEIVLDQGPHGSLLELGTSNLLPFAFRDLSPDISVSVSEFDLSAPQRESGKSNYGEHSTPVEVFRVNLEETALPVEDGLFDFVLCCEVIEHLEKDPMFMLSEINRVLKDNGTLILSTPNITSSRAISKILRGIDPYFYMQYRHDGSLYRHNYEYSVWSLTAVLQAAGFAPNIWTEDTFENPATEDVERLRSAGYSLDHIGDNIFVVARKISNVKERYPASIYAD